MEPILHITSGDTSGEKPDRAVSTKLHWMPFVPAPKHLLKSSPTPQSKQKLNIIPTVPGTACD